MNPKLHAATLAVFVSAFFLSIGGQYGGDKFVSYLTAGSIVFNHNLAIAVRPFNLPDIQTKPGGVPLGAGGKRHNLYGIALLELLGAAECWRRWPELSALWPTIAAASMQFNSTYCNFLHGDLAWGPRCLFHGAFQTMLPVGEVLEHDLLLVQLKSATFSALVA